MQPSIKGGGRKLWVHLNSWLPVSDPTRGEGKKKRSHYGRASKKRVSESTAREMRL